MRLLTDGDGYRLDRPEDRGRGGADLSILMVGDSFLEALAVENPATIPRLVADSLAARHATTVRVDNTSAGGWDPNHYRMEARRALSKRKYDLGVVFFYPGNDAVDAKLDSIAPRPPSIRHPLRFPRRPAWREIVSSVLYPINDALETRSHLFMFLKKRSTDLRARLGLTPFARSIPVFFVLLPSVYQVDERILESYQKWFKIDRSTIDVGQPNRG